MFGAPLQWLAKCYIFISMQVNIFPKKYHQYGIAAATQLFQHHSKEELN